jgi:hypothetical protein
MAFQSFSNNHLFSEDSEMTVVLVLYYYVEGWGHRNSTPNVEVSFSRTRS